MKRLAIGTIVMGLLAGIVVHGQQAAPPQGQGASRGPAPRAPAPAPRWPDGRISFSGSPKDVGNWEGPANASIFFDIADGKQVRPAASLATNKSVDEIPFAPGMRKLYDSRADHSKDPHSRCKPSGGARFWHTPYGIEIIDLPETKEIIFLHVGAPHSWRIAYLDGREHPKDPKPMWYGHTTGKWQGDTLVMDTVGFNGRFWLTREGVPATSKLHLIEKMSRPNHDELRYEATVDDPGAYTAPWSGGWNLRWGEGNEPFDYLCQENNRDPARMIGGNVDARP
ncbi:MAG: hypothetical protein ABI645_12935 [Pseudomonadota bacterium]